MKTKKSLVTLCLPVGLFASAPGISLADVNIVPQNTTVAPITPTVVPQQLTWTPVDQSKTQFTQPASADRRLDIAGITGPATAYSVPANIDELTLTLSSEVSKQASVFVPNVSILDQNMMPSVFFPNSYSTHQGPGMMGADRLEGIMRLVPALGRQKLYVLVSTTDRDPQQTTTLPNPTKAYAKGVGNAALDIPDPIARHTTDGLLKLRVKTSSSFSVLVGPLLGPSGPSSATVGSTAAPVVAHATPAAAVAAPASQPVKKSESVLNDTESYSNQAIKDAVAKGDVDKALKLPDEAECPGSKSA